MKNIAIALAVGLILGGALVWKFYPRVQIETKVEEVVKKDIRTVVRVIEKPDGSKVTESETIDRSREQTTATQKVNPPALWLASVGVASKLDRQDPVYNLTVQRRILGPFFLGAGLNTKGAGNVTLTMEF
jgi:hypothetical protein